MLDSIIDKAPDGVGAACNDPAINVGLHEGEMLGIKESQIQEPIPLGIIEELILITTFPISRFSR